MVLIVCQYEQQRVVELERLNTFKLMLEKEQQFVETKRSDLGRGYNPSVAIELANAEKRVRELQQKYNQMANRLGLSTSESQPQVHSHHFANISFKLHHQLDMVSSLTKTELANSKYKTRLLLQTKRSHSIWL